MFNGNNLFLILLIFYTLVSCSHSSNNKILKIKSNPLEAQRQEFILDDKNEQFKIITESNIKKKSKEYIVKKSMFNKNANAALEKSIAFSKVGKVKKQPLLQPSKSEFNIWFDNKKYTSKITVLPQKKSLSVVLNSPEAMWQGEKIYPFPKSNTVFCFYSQMVECLQYAQVFQKLKAQHSIGEEKSYQFYLIWEGFPYIADTLTQFKNEVFSKARIEYDGTLEGQNQSEEKTLKNGWDKFTLTIQGQNMALILDRDFHLKKMFWVTQGMSMLEKKTFQVQEQAQNINDLDNSFTE